MLNGEKDTEAGPYTSWYALPELVGRDDLIRRAVESLIGEEKRVVFLVGPGGIGKTRVLEAIVQRLREEARQGHVYVVEQMVDLYHTETHTMNGLADALYEVSDFLEHVDFPSMYKELVNLWVTGVGAGSAELRREHLDLFVQILTTVCQERPTILALDTVEKLVYGMPNLSPDLKGQVADAWEWLLGLLAKNPRLYMVLSGRPEAERLFERIAAQLGEDQVLHLPVGPLDEDAGLAYFAAVQREAERRRDWELLPRLEGLDDEARRKAVRWARGVPIRLALMIDFMVLGENLPLAESTLEGEWEGRFFERLQQEPFWDALIALGRLPKGADVELICAILEYEPGDDGREQVQELLRHMRYFTFTKVLEVPGIGQRYFLHDEMYRILERQLFNHPLDAEAASRVHEAIKAYYEAQQQIWRKEMTDLFAEVEEGRKEQVDKIKLSDLYKQQLALYTSDVYYALRRDPAAGFRRCYRYTRDADLSGNVALDYALQAELLTFMGETASGRIRTDHPNSTEEFEGMLLMRPLVRAWVEENYDKALDEATEIRKQAQGLLQDDLNTAILNAWEAYALIYLGRNFEKTKKLLSEAITHAEKHAKNENSTRSWRARAIQAFALRVRGYLYDSQEQLQLALLDYEKAVPLWRDLNIQIESATTLKDMAYSLALRGHFDRATRLVQYALELHRKLASLGNVGLSLNAQALIRMMDGDYEEAITGAVRALRLSRAIGAKRSIGLASLALAEATRRSMGPEAFLPLRDKIEKLQQIHQDAKEAYDRLSEIKQEAYVIKALIEMGCNRRDIVHICTEHPEICAKEGIKKSQVDELRNESAEYLREAATRAQKIANISLQLDSLVNLGWLGYFAENVTLCTESERMVRQSASVLYSSPEADHPRLSQDNDTFVSQWEQLGKHYVMRGAQEFRNNGLKETGHLWTRALCYSSQKGTNYANFRRAKDFFYRHLKPLNRERLEQVACGVVLAEKHLQEQGGSLMREFLRESFLWVEPDSDSDC